MSKETDVEIKIWDLPVRLFHWILVLLLVFQVVTGSLGGELMDWHVVSGYAILVLVVFRILWGFAGSTPARFASFVRGPAAAIAFARRLFSRQPATWVGHNPLGGWSVVAMIALLALQVASGLFANDGVATQGPLAGLVSLDLSNQLSDFHSGNARVLVVLSALHVVAVLYHWLVKKDTNLMAAMFTGVRRVPQAPEGLAPPWFPSPWRAVAVLAAALAFFYLLVMGPFREEGSQPIAVEMQGVTRPVTGSTAPRPPRTQK